MPFVSLASIETKSLLPGFTGKFIHTPGLTLAYWRVAAGSELPPHSHLHEQVTHILEGEFEMTLENETQTVVAGTVAVIGAHQLHSGKAITDCHILDVFTPVREDYKAAPSTSQ